MNAGRNTDPLDSVLRDTLHTWAPQDPGPPPGIADRLVRRRRRRGAVRAAGTALALAGVVLGAALATGAARDDAPPAFRISEESDLLWRTALPGSSWDACAVGPGTVHCRGTGHDVIRVDSGTGKVVWQRPAAVTGATSSPAGALPGVRDGILYTYADHSPGSPAAGTDLVAVDADSSRVLWRQRLADDARDRDSAVLFDGGILAHGPRPRAVTALHPRTGRTLWTHGWERAACDRAAVDGVPYLMCSPDDAAATGEGGTVVRLDPGTGEPRTVATVDGPTRYVGTDGDAVLLVGAEEGGTAADGSGPATLVRVDLRTGDVTRHRTDGFPAGVVAEGVILSARQDGSAVAYSARDGGRLWSRDLGLELRAEPGDPTARELPSAAAVDPARRMVYYLGPTGRLTGLDLDSGAVRWRARVPVPAGPVAAGVAPELMVADGTLVGLVGGELFRVRPVLIGRDS